MTTNRTDFGPAEATATAGQLASQMALLETVFRNAPIGLAVVDRDFRYISVNDTLAAINGLSAADHIGRSPREILPHLWPAIEPQYRRTLRGETVRNHEVTGRTVIDTEHHWLVSYYPVRVENEIIGVGIVVNDVTELHAYQRTLRTRTDLCAMISQASKAAITRTTEADLFEDVCRIAVETGHFRFAWIGVPDGDRLRPVATAGDDGGYLTNLVVTLDPDDPRSHGPSGRAFTTGSPTIVNDFDQASVTAPWHDLARRAGVAASAAFPFVENGRVVAVFQVYAAEKDFFVDELLDTVSEVVPIVTYALDAMATRRERERGDAALRLQDRAIRAVTQGICIADVSLPDSPIIFASAGFERLTGYRADEVIGSNCRMLQGAETDPETAEILRRAITGGTGVTVEILNYRKDGTPFWNELTIAPVSDERGLLTHFVGVQSDVTLRRQLEQQARQSQKMEAVGLLASGVAHDFNNLLTVVDVCSDMLVHALKPDDPSRELAVEIQRAGERAGSLTRQLLAFSHKQVLAPRSLDLNTVVSDSEKFLRRLIGEHILFTTRLHEPIASVFADPGQVEQVLINLVVNARDAMPMGGSITVSTGERTLFEAERGVPAGDWATLEVSDTGTGMDDMTMRRIFEPFFTTKGVGRGTGLGLATVHSIVETASGHVTVDTKLGEGSTFRVYLPRITAQSESTAERAAGVTPTGTETILLAEDDDALRSLGRRILERCGYQVLQAADGEEALRHAREYAGEIDLLVSDVVMPHLGGRQLADSMLAVRPRMRVLFVSGYTDDEVLLHGVVHADVAMLQKPYSLVALAQMVRKVLDA
jgi:PAS domain S-box-containing protein